MVSPAVHQLKVYAGPGGSEAFQYIGQVAMTDDWVLVKTNGETGMEVDREGALGFFDDKSLDFQ